MKTMHILAFDHATKRIGVAGDTHICVREKSSLHLQKAPGKFCVLVRGVA